MLTINYLVTLITQLLHHMHPNLRMLFNFLKLLIDCDQASVAVLFFFILFFNLQQLLAYSLPQSWTGIHQL